MFKLGNKFERNWTIRRWVSDDLAIFRPFFKRAGAICRHKISWLGKAADHRCPPVESRNYFCLFLKIKRVLFCCSLCILLVRVTFTRFYVSEHEFNNVRYVNTVFWKFNFWRQYELVGSGPISILLVIGGSDRVGNLAGRNINLTTWRMLFYVNIFFRKFNFWRQ